MEFPRGGAEHCGQKPTSRARKEVARQAPRSTMRSGLRSCSSPAPHSLRRSRRSALACSASPAAPSPLLLPPPVSTSVKLLVHLLSQGGATAAKLDELRLERLDMLAAAARASLAEPPSADLSARIAALSAAEARDAEVAELLAFAVGKRLADCGAQLRTGLPADADASPSSELLTPEALPLLLSNQPEALTELLAHVDAAVPSSAPAELLVRLDAQSGGRLYAGSVQFGYFVRSFFVRADAAPISEPQLRAMAQSMRSRQAWSAATARAAALWALPDPADCDSFSTRVTVVPSNAASEFYSSGAPPPSSEEAEKKESLPPRSSLIPLTAGGLRGLLAEAVLWGWCLKGEEERVEAEGPGLLTPPERRVE